MIVIPTTRLDFAADLFLRRSLPHFIDISRYPLILLPFQNLP